MDTFSGRNVLPHMWELRAEGIQKKKKKKENWVYSAVQSSALILCTCLLICPEGEIREKA